MAVTTNNLDDEAKDINVSVDLPTIVKSENDIRAMEENKKDAPFESEPSGLASPAAGEEKEPDWAHGWKLANILAAAAFVCFLVLMDGSIIVTAIPRITNDFHSLTDVGWYGAAYQLGRYERLLDS